MGRAEIKQITAETASALRMPNEKFKLFGKLIVTKTASEWHHQEELFDEITEMVFPDEEYLFDVIEKQGFAVGAFLNEKPVGLAVFEYRWNKYAYLSDLKVSRASRKQGIAREMLDLARQIAHKNGYSGLSTIAQDNNLAANRFYLKYGFKIGGLNTQDYQFTSQKGKADIYYYLEMDR
ncbi:acetyltransferase [Listeria floridensis FSL S10-1187]|uniref:Acetyltransferase n=1 Tax=Listeria floridensis FSL S10-1187 TaxID=1265817 RepID=A0ABN0RIF2_9LIST|nr:GNAT family N-acetyltransferase [Listeria floridensis]EUJ33783.1 acetyltransferase [Listeria floridensis FSL S10-1187]